MVVNMPSIETLTALAELDPVTFEAQRTQLINTYINSLPLDKQKTARSMQNDLDLKRLSLSSTDFLEYCCARIRTNLEKIGELATQATIITADMKNVLAKEESNVVPLHG